MSELTTLPIEQNCSDCATLSKNDTMKQADRLFITNGSIQSAIAMSAETGRFDELVSLCSREHETHLEAIFSFIANLDEQSRHAVLGQNEPVAWLFRSIGWLGTQILQVLGSTDGATDYVTRSHLQTLSMHKQCTELMGMPVVVCSFVRTHCLE